MNGKKQYYYDPETCSFVEVETTWRQWLSYAGQIVGLAVLLTGLAVWAMDVYWVTTPEEQSLRVENRALEQQLSQVNARMSSLSSRLDTLAKRDRTLYRRLFQMEPISDDVRQVGVGGADPYEKFDKMDATASSLLQNTAQKLDKLERQMTLQGTSYRKLTKVAKKRDQRLRQLPAIRPANGPIVSGYGMRHHPVLDVRKMHAGVDFLLRPGTPVMATGDGEIRRAGQHPTYGNYVDVRHPQSGYITRYAHLSEIAEGVRRGKEVERGEKIGNSGNTGRTTGPHLHYEVRTLEGRTLDPMRFFVPDMTPETYHELEERTQHYEARAESTADTAGGQPRTSSAR